MTPFRKEYRSDRHINEVQPLRTTNSGPSYLCKLLKTSKEVSNSSHRLHALVLAKNTRFSILKKERKIARWLYMGGLLSMSF